MSLSKTNTTMSSTSLISSNRILISLPYLSCKDLMESEQIFKFTCQQIDIEDGNRRECDLMEFSQFLIAFNKFCVEIATNFDCD